MEKQRHYCINCRRKIYEEKMYRLVMPYSWVRIWVCEDCYKRYRCEVVIDRLPGRQMSTEVDKNTSKLN